MSVQVLHPFLKPHFVCLFDVELCYINSLSDVSFANVFSHSVGALFILLIVSFAVQKVLVWYSPICLFLLLFPLPKSPHKEWDMTEWLHFDFFFHFPLPKVIYPKNISLTNVKVHTACIFIEESHDFGSYI